MRWDEILYCVQLGMLASACGLAFFLTLAAFFEDDRGRDPLLRDAGTDRSGSRDGNGVGSAEIVDPVEK